MTRLGTLPLLLLTGMASAASAPTPEEDLATLGYISAARPGEFHAVPPSGNGFPEDILANMRIKLGGERPLPQPQQTPQTSAPEAPANGH